MANLKATKQYAYFFDYFSFILKTSLCYIDWLSSHLTYKSKHTHLLREPMKTAKQGLWSGYPVQVQTSTVKKIAAI